MPPPKRAKALPANPKGKPARERQPRDMYTGNATTLAAAIQPWMTDSAVFENVAGNISPSLLMRHRELLKGLRIVRPSMNFQKLKMREAIEICTNNMNEHWKTPVEESLLSKTIDVNAELVRKMTRHIAKTVSKAPTTGWLKILFATGPPPAKSSKKPAANIPDATMLSAIGSATVFPAAKLEETSDTPPVEYVFGYDNDSKRAYREQLNVAGKRKKQKSALKDWFEDWDIKPEARDTDTAWARWPDGVVAEIVDVTVGEVRGQVDTKGARLIYIYIYIYIHHGPELLQVDMRNAPRVVSYQYIYMCVLLIAPPRRALEGNRAQVQTDPQDVQIQGVYRAVREERDLSPEV